MSSTEAEKASQSAEQPDPTVQQNGSTAHAEEETKAQEKADDAEGTGGKADEHKPEGGFDATPLPSAPAGYTLKFTFIKALNLPMADLNSLSSDPYIIAELKTDIPGRHKEDPPLRKRTPTIRRSTSPEWNCEWIVANVPASGFRLKCRIYDEDPATKDDRLGNAHIHVSGLSESWTGIDNQAFRVKKRSGSKRAYLARMFATCIGAAKHMHGDLYVSVELLGRTDTNEGGRVYTVGPIWWTKHFSPLLGRLAGTKDDDDGDQPDHANEKQRTQRFNFQANQMQLTGPVPWQMYHRFVEFKPFVKSMFTATGVRGFLLSKALHHQHARVYAYDRNTLYGVLPGDSSENARQFLDLVHYDEGGRIFTYVLTLDSLWRFTETGKEFGIDMLSKHTMHSDVNVYIAFSGEFFIRRLKKKSATSEDVQEGNVETHPPDKVNGGPPDSKPPKDPAYYELVIDNDSGTYRPNAKLLPLLKEFLETHLPGLKDMTLDCQADAERMGKMKQEQRDRKEKEGEGIIYTQWDQSSISSSEDEALDEVEQRTEDHKDPNFLASVKRDQSAKNKARAQRAKDLAKGRDRGDAGPSSESNAVDDSAEASEVKSGAADTS